MVELIKIHEQNNQQLVDARELHEFLGIGKDFSNWIKYRINQYGFIENHDYVLLAKIGEQTGRGGHNSIEYALTLDMAKELCMVENNDRGRQARRYFIEIEKKAKSLMPPSRKELALMVIQQEEELARLNEENQRKDKAIMELMPKVELMQRVLDAEEKIDIGQAAKILNLPYGRNKLFKELRNRGVFFKERNEPKQQYIDKGYFILKEKWIQRNHNNSFVVIKTLVTQKGLEFLSKILDSRPGDIIQANMI